MERSNESDEGVVVLIGLTGKKRSGKDTVADYLRDEMGFFKYALADPMKKACEEIFYMDESQLWGDRKEEIDPRYGVTPREIMQVFATEMFQFDIYKHLPNLSVPPRMLWINRFKMAYHSEHNWVISDMRFPHEAEAIREMGGKVVKIIRRGADTGAYNNHLSEKEVEKIHPDYAINNNGSIRLLQAKVGDMLEFLGWKPKRW